MTNPHYWPSMTDYQEALQSPSLAFSSTEIQSGARRGEQSGFAATDLRHLCERLRVGQRSTQMGSQMLPAEYSGPA